MEEHTNPFYSDEDYSEEEEDSTYSNPFPSVGGNGKLNMELIELKKQLQNRPECLTMALTENEFAFINKDHNTKNDITSILIDEEELKGLTKEKLDEKEKELVQILATELQDFNDEKKDKETAHPILLNGLSDELTKIDTKREEKIDEKSKDNHLVNDLKLLETTEKKKEENTLEESEKKDLEIIDFVNDFKCDPRVAEATEASETAIAKPSPVVSAEDAYPVTSPETSPVVSAEDASPVTSPVTSPETSPVVSAEDASPVTSPAVSAEDSAELINILTSTPVFSGDELSKVLKNYTIKQIAAITEAIRTGNSSFGTKDITNQICKKPSGTDAGTEWGTEQMYTAMTDGDDDDINKLVAKINILCAIIEKKKKK
jgi:hypothetical protein